MSDHMIALLRFLCRITKEVIITSLLLGIGFALGYTAMWKDVSEQCSATRQHFVPWGDENGYECFYEGRYNSRPAIEAKPFKYNL